MSKNKLLTGFFMLGMMYGVKAEKITNHGYTKGPYKEISTYNKALLDIIDFSSNIRYNEGNFYKTKMKNLIKTASEVGNPAKFVYQEKLDGLSENEKALMEMMEATKKESHKELENASEEIDPEKELNAYKEEIMHDSEKNQASKESENKEIMSSILYFDKNKKDNYLQIIEENAQAAVDNYNEKSANRDDAISDYRLSFNNEAKGKTDDQIWERIKGKSDFIYAKEANGYEAAKLKAAKLQAKVKAIEGINKLYDMRKAGINITVADVKDYETDFMKALFEAQDAVEDDLLSKRDIPNYSILEDMEEGVKKMEHVVKAKEGLEELLPKMNAPKSDNFDLAHETIYQHIVDARKIGPVNEHFGENFEDLEKFSIIYGRIMHMKAKDQVKEDYSDISDKFPEPYKLTENDLYKKLDNRKTVAQTIEELNKLTSSYNMYEDADSMNSWEDKYLENGKGSEEERIKEYIARIRQLTDVINFKNFLEEENLLNSLTRNSLNLKGKKDEILTKDEKYKWDKADRKLSLIIKKDYLSVGAESDLVKEDFERIMGKAWIKKYREARENYLKATDQSGTYNHIFKIDRETNEISIGDNNDEK